MLLKLKKDPQGVVVLKDDKPVYVNSDTGGEIELDADRLFTENTNLRHEAETHRKGKEAAELALKPFEGIDPVKAKEAAAELAKLKADPAATGRAKAPTQEELDRMVDERFQAKLAEMTTELEGTRTKLTTTEKERDAARGDFRGLKLDTEYAAAADKVGIRKECRDDALRYVREGWKVEDDGVPRKRDVNGKVIPGTDPTKPLSIEEELRTVTARDKRIWLPPAKGTEHIHIPGQAGPADAASMSTTELFALGLQTPTAG